MTDRLTIGVDIDGVLADYIGDFGDFVRNRDFSEFGLDMEAVVPTTPTSWNFFEGWGIERTDYDFIHRLWALQGGFENCSMVPDDDPRAWLQAVAADHEIYYLTARSAYGIRPSTIEFQTRRWLQEREFPEGQLVLDQDKASAAFYLNLDIHVDDSPDVIFEIAEANWLRRIDTYPVIRHQPWNASTEFPYRSHRVDKLAGTDPVIAHVVENYLDRVDVEAADE